MIKPILFNTDMVRAILDDRKGATRRVVKGFIPDDAIWGYTAFTPKGYISCRGIFADGYGEKFFKLPCEPGDILYVRETWGICNLNDDENIAYIVYKASENEEGEGCRAVRLPNDKLEKMYDSMAENSPDWKPSIHMPKEAARIWLKVKDVRVERLQEIDDEQAKAEGANWKNGKNVGFEEKIRRSAVERFAEIWDSTIKKPDIAQYGWKANPWVWVIEFERCEKPKEG